ncbi:chemotaxis protein CheA [Pseudomonas sp. C27(2019)]|uniref:chemotaxis protein CheA n=1 Tax=Pseudomonas sp. C27(2019) TaxID=2604941 RepID=UPI001246F885|nr:chemotaxis protein CheA [Pseudomonas sp. C27(2019)]QEY59123.1 chemotaxis protein CheA [Pseudomonas sp. C27(2019)]
MGFDADEEILQDFIVEAGEILELLSEQLIELEGSPDDMNLLNAIFRGFHTVKGGAGFLQLNELVSCCHIAENVFDILRKGERRVTPELMDVVLQALDSVNVMFQEVRDGVALTPASDELLAELERLAQPDSEEEAAVAETQESVVPQQSSAADQADAEFEHLLDAISEQSPALAHSSSGQADDSSSDIITDEEFEALLDQLHGPVGEPAVPESQPLEMHAAAASDQITDDEFEALLDQLHGEGKFNADTSIHGTSAADSVASAGACEALDVALSDTSSDITDDEFESLLDKLHGKGKFDVHVKSSAVDTQNVAAKKPAESSAAVTQKTTPPARSAAPAGRAPEIETTVRVDTARLDDIMNMVGELVLVRNRLVRLGLNSGDETMSKVLGNLDVVTGDLQAAVMKTRMQPIKKVFGRFPRLVRDMARSLKKQIRLELVGEETDLDKNLVEALADPLVHLVRNSVDHGIEMPDEREAAGKEREGRVILAAAQEGDHIQLTISDDGKGMDANVLRNKAVEKGMLDREAADRLSDLECYNLIFAAGFSTKTEVSDVSGRGVGMDVVKTKISQLNGSVNVYSTPGQGSQVVIKVPLTLAIMPTLMVLLGDQAFAFPLVSVNEIFHLDLSRTNIVDGQEVVIVRDKALPLFYLKQWLLPNETHTEQTEGHVVILAVGNKRIGCVVDQLVGQEEVVIKPLGKMLHGTPGMSGATITGDGRIALILDVPGLLENYGQRY